MESEVKDQMTSSAISGDNTSTSSDNESWTILDEDETIEQNVLSARIDVVQNLAEFSARSVSPVRNISPRLQHRESDSDIDVIEEERKISAAESNLESLNSDGIPVGEELSEHGAQYLWSSEDSNELTSSQNETIKDETDNIDNCEDYDEDDLEIIDNSETTKIRENDEKTTSNPLCSSGYPPEELMDRFSEIVKGKTYLHQPNQALNLYLTATLVIVAALVIGLGLGHFKGWSERLELQEQYADIREERMEELTESLVTCMTGEEGRGGDDQDLDDIVIRQLREENEKLKDELVLLREVTASDTSVHEEMSAILRDRINDLLVANADLEKEVVRLRYSPPEVIVQDTVVESELELLETKEELNTMAHENEQLKLAIGKERYGPRQVPIEQKQELNILKTENEELKNEVRKFRYGVHNSPFLDLTNNGYEPLDDFDEDEGYNTTDEAFEDDLELDQTTDFITLTKLQPVLPPVILMGGKVPQGTLDEDVEEDDEDIDEVEVEDDPEVEDDEELEDVDDYFKSFKSYLKENFDKKLGLDVAKVGQVIDEFKKNAKDLIPDKVQIQQIKESAEELGSVLKEKWHQLDIKEEKRKVDKLAKTIVKALNKAKDAISEEFAPDKELWSQRLHRIQQGFQSKWEEVMNKFMQDEKKAKTCDSKKPKHRKNNKGTKKDDGRSSKSSGKDPDIIKSNEKKNYTSWSFQSSKHSNASWIFSRAKNRDESRKETMKSDWLFDRASSRKRFHDLNKAEWFNRKVYGKHCNENGDCETIDYETYQNNKKSNKKASSNKRGETEHLNMGQEFVFVPNQDQKHKMEWSSKNGKVDERFIRGEATSKRKLRSFDLIRDSEDDDDDSDENEEEFEEHVFKYVQRGGRFGGTKKRPHLETSKNFRGLHQEEKKSKKAEKRGRFHHKSNNQNHQRKQFFADQVVHFNQKFH